MSQNIFTKIYHSISHLFYPHLCLQCGIGVENGKFLCGFHEAWLLHLFENESGGDYILSKFPSIIPIVFAYSICPYKKGTLPHKLIHEFKYRSRPEIAFWLGEWMGKKFLENFTSQSIVDYIVPIPLTKERQKKRGYNQAEKIADGISTITGIPVLNNLLVRKKFIVSQTKLNVSGRKENVKNSFGIKDDSMFNGKHFLIVDDVLTTGATVLEVVKLLLTIQGAKISVMTFSVVV